MLGKLSIPNTVKALGRGRGRGSGNGSSSGSRSRRRSGRRKAVVSAALAAGLFAGGAGAALAASWHTIPRLKSSGALFSSGTYRFNPKGTEHGGFEFKGKLKDTDSGDGHNVYVEVRVEGYDWNRFYGKQKKTVSLHKLVYDAAAQYTSDAGIRVCRDKGTLHPDNCATAPHYKR
ncbi:hypothetical protein ACWCPT_02635 [Streptomyces sp. NPDC002308]